MNGVLSVFKREFLGYFRSPVAYVFLIVFVVATVGLTWFVGNYFKGNEASLVSLFSFLPWIFVIFIPAVGMRLWAEEKKSGTWELLLTLPVSTGQAVWGKFLAGWAFVTVAILLTFPLVFTTMYLGAPDYGPIFTGYLMSVLMAGTYLSICSFMSALTRSQVISFVLSVIVCLVLVLAGWHVFENVLYTLPVGLADAVTNFTFIPNYMPAVQGLITFSSLIYFVSLSAFFLFLNVIVLER